MTHSFQDWKYETPIIAGATITVPCGGEVCTGYRTKGEAYDRHYLHFGVYADQETEFEIVPHIASSTPRTWFKLIVPANTLYTAYDCPSPIGDNGFIVVPWPFFNMTLKNSSAVNHTTLSFYARLQNY